MGYVMSEQSEVSKVPVSRRALLLRINKKLSDKGLAVKAARGRACRFMGSYYAIDLSQNQIAGRRIDVENLARKLGALADWEEMERASRPNPTKPVTKSGSEPGSGIADGGEVSNTAVRRGLDASGLVEEAYDIGRQG